MAKILPDSKFPLVTNSPLDTAPVTVYVVVTVGDATGFAILGSLKPAAGDQEYKSAPVAPSCVEAPLQMLLSEPAFTFSDTLLIVTD